MILAIRNALRRMDRFYPGLQRVQLSRAARTALLLNQVQAAINHQSTASRPWQRYEPLSGFLDSDLWPTDQTVLQDLTFAKLAIQVLSDRQIEDLELALSE
jgi:hypothetical protein